MRGNCPETCTLGLIKTTEKKNDFCDGNCLECGYWDSSMFHDSYCESNCCSRKPGDPFPKPKLICEEGKYLDLVKKAKAYDEYLKKVDSGEIEVFKRKTFEKIAEEQKEEMGKIWNESINKRIIEKLSQPLNITISSNEQGHGSTIDIEGAKFGYVPVGDIVAEGKDCVIERKEINDFAGSCSSPHLWRQCIDMKNNYKQCIVAIVGYLEDLDYRNKPKIPHIYKSIAALSRMGITVLWLKNDKMLSSIIPAIFKVANKKDPSIPIKKLQNDDKHSILQGITGIGNKKATLLLEKFENINKISNASIEELCSVKGINEKIATKLHESLN